jgi:deazaflavin-dependent oxidoreductase (nitroreductase family)
MEQRQWRRCRAVPQRQRQDFVWHVQGRATAAAHYHWREERINPLAFTRDGDNYVIIASKGGSPTHPDWYYNILANPEVGVEVATQSGVDQFAAHARIAEGDERQRLYDAQAAVMPNFAEYQKKTSREIPVVVVEPHR